MHAHERWTAGLVETLTSSGERYGVPMLVTETSIEGGDALRAARVRDSVAAVTAPADGTLARVRDSVAAVTAPADGTLDRVETSAAEVFHTVATATTGLRP